MNIHEHQAKDILRKYGAPVSNGVVILSIDEIISIKSCALKFLSTTNAKSLSD